MASLLLPGHARLETTKGKREGVGGGEPAGARPRERRRENVPAASGLEWGAMIYGFIMKATGSHWSIFK